MKCIIMKHRTSKYVQATLAACIVLGINNVVAAEELKEFNLSGTVVTATRSEMQSKDVPQAVQVITAQDMKELAAQNVFDALKLATNINLSKASMVGNNVQIRGMDSRHTLILIDGKKMAGEDSSETANMYELSRINLDNIERIEIVRGPGSVMYGSDAMGGVINIITKKSSSSKPEYHISADAGSNERNLAFRFDSGKQDKLRVQAGARHTSVLLDSEFGTDSTNMYGDRQHYDLSFDYDLGKGRGLEFSAAYMQEDLTQDTSGDGKEWFDNTRQSYSISYYGKDAINDYNIRAYYNELEKTSKKSAAGIWNNFDRMKYKTYVLEGKNTAKLSAQHRLTYGAEYSNNKARSTRMGSGGEHAYIENYLGLSKTSSEKSVSTSGMYVQDEWRVSNKLIVLPAIRLDHHSSFGSHLTPKVGATYSFAENSRLKINYGKGYRAPTIFELYSEMNHTPIPAMRVEVYGNANLKPETSRTFDISLEAERNNLWGKFTYFNNDIKNLIDIEIYQIVPGRPMVTKGRYVNINRAEINGLEVEGGLNLDKNFTIKSTYNYLDAKNKHTGERLSDRARHNGTLQFVYSDNKVNPLTMTLWQEWNIDYYYTWNNSPGKDYTFSTTNFSVHKKINKQLDLFAGVNNIFDKKYKPTETEPFYLGGRTWRLGVNLNF